MRSICNISTSNEDSIFKQLIIIYYGNKPISDRRHSRCGISHVARTTVVCDRAVLKNEDPQIAR
jgi:hypothetical protein